MALMLLPDNDRLYERVDSLLSKIHIKYENKQAAEIMEAVSKYIKMLVNEVEKKKPQFRVSDILKVGSFNEGTKIISPNEFDFLAVIDELSRPGAIAAERDSALPGNALLTFNDDRMKERWEKYCVNGYLCCFQQHIDTTGGVYVTQDTFGSLVVKVIHEISGKRRAIVEDYRIEFTDKENPNYRCKLSELDQIQLSRVEAKEPNVLLDFIVEDCLINVDLSPVIRYHPVEDCFNATDCASSMLATSVVNRGSILLVGKIGNEFRISFTETEVDYMQTKIVKKHKLLYMYLKYIMHLFSSCMTPMTSYMLKMICICHDLECADIDQKLSVCFDEVISVIARCFEEENVPSVFNMKLSLNFPLDVHDYRQHVLGAIRQISQLDLPCVYRPSEGYNLKMEGIVKDTIRQYTADCGEGCFT